MRKQASRSRFRIPVDHNHVTSCPAAIKAKITVFEKAAMDYAFIGAAMPSDAAGITAAAQTARYNLEQTILTYIRSTKND